MDCSVVSVLLETPQLLSANLLQSLFLSGFLCLLTALLLLYLHSHTATMTSQLQLYLATLQMQHQHQLDPSVCPQV